MYDTVHQQDKFNEMFLKQKEDFCIKLNFNPNIPKYHSSLQHNMKQDETRTATDWRIDWMEAKTYLETAHPEGTQGKDTSV